MCQRIGEWTSHLPYQLGQEITQSPNKVYYATEWSILAIDKDDFSSERISKVNALSDIGISELAYDTYNDQLVIAYTNGNLDILTENNTINLPNILTNSDLTGNKQINKIHIADGSNTYLGTGFGLVNISSEDLLFGFTTFTNVPVNDIATTDDRIYIATDDGVYFAPSDGSQNLIDFSLWTLLDTELGLPSLYSSEAIVVYDQDVYFAIDDTLYRIDDGGKATDVYHSDENSTISFLSAGTSALMIGVANTEGNGKVVFYTDDQINESGNACTDRIKDAIEDQDGRIWYADEFGGFRTASSASSSCDRLNFNSPFSHEVSDIALKGSDIFIASGGIRENYDYRFTRNGYYANSEQSWTNYNQDSHSFLREKDLLNFLTILPHPDKDELYVGTYWGGLLKQDLASEEYTLYDDTNSSLLGTIGDEQRERITGLAFDESNNLWVTSFGSPRPLALMTENGEWYNFPLFSNKNLTGITIDMYGNFWMPAFGNNGGCYIYNPGENVMSSADDQVLFLSSNNSELPTNIVNTASVDLDGALWLGTNEGPVVFDCGSDPFDLTNCQGSRIKVTQDSIVALLLADQDILAISIDGANQKWLGTRNGLFVQSSDGKEEINRFNESNSPLFDNRIRDLAYNDESGIMYIGSDKGVQAIKTESTKAAPFHQESNVLVYPNPVEPNYTGPISIRGLVRDAQVKITDVNGNLVTQINAKGGQAIWNGQDLNGQEVVSGVYLIFSADENAFDSPDSFVTKVMIIR